jgi:hypothetical protein
VVGLNRLKQGGDGEEHGEETHGLSQAAAAEDAAGAGGARDARLFLRALSRLIIWEVCMESCAGDH